jgi:ribosomal protein S18 acetylase RimI-like enzyme
VLEHARGLSAEALLGLAELERLVIAADGGRLKLEWEVLRARSGDRVEDLLWWDHGQVCGFVGLYSFGSPVELAGMVAPASRRRGVGTALLDAAIALCRSRGEQVALLVVPRASIAGRTLALARGAQLDHSEHALAMTGLPKNSTRTLGVTVRSAVGADWPVVLRLIEAGFGQPAHDITEEPEATRGETFVIEHDGQVAGTIRVNRHAQDATIYGFVIDPELQGRGLGREALRQLCDRLTAQGAARIGIEVEVDNERALTLYTSLGFEPVTTEDYFSIPTT